MQISQENLIGVKRHERQAFSDRILKAYAPFTDDLIALQFVMYPLLQINGRRGLGHRRACDSRRVCTSQGQSFVEVRASTYARGDYDRKIYAEKNLTFLATVILGYGRLRWQRRSNLCTWLTISEPAQGAI
ncbi:hypothetical protein MY11210_008916 [Beauveria gryllotalpidicola]